MKKTIAVVIASWNGVIGGTEQHVSFLLNSLPRMGYAVQFIVANRPDDDEFPGVKVEPLVLQVPGKTGIGGLVARIIKLAHHFRHNPPDLILAYFPEGEMIASIAACMAGMRNRLVGNRRNMGHEYTPRSLWQARLISKLVPRFLTNSAIAGRVVSAREWIPWNRFSVIYNPFNDRSTISGSDEIITNLPEGCPLIGIVASVKPIKNHSLFLDAARELLRSVPDAHFVIVGRALPPDHKRLMAGIEERGLALRVHYLGEYADPLPVIRKLSIGVLCSKSEGLSNALVEYACMGVPAVATDVGGNAEVVVHGRTGYLVPPDDAVVLSSRLKELLENEQLRKDMGYAAQQRAEELFSSKSILNQYTTYFSGVLEKASV